MTRYSRHKERLYQCRHCGKIVKRKSDKAWVKSWCEKTGKTVHLMRVEATHD